VIAVYNHGDSEAVSVRVRLSTDYTVLDDLNPIRNLRLDYSNPINSYLPQLIWDAPLSGVDILLSYIVFKNGNAFLLTDSRNFQSDGYDDQCYEVYSIYERGASPPVELSLAVGTLHPVGLRAYPITVLDYVILEWIVPPPSSYTLVGFKIWRREEGVSFGQPYINEGWLMQGNIVRLFSYENGITNEDISDLLGTPGYPIKYYDDPHIAAIYTYYVYATYKVGENTFEDSSPVRLGKILKHSNGRLEVLNEN
jgi:hypothetical protein